MAAPHGSQTGGHRHDGPPAAGAATIKRDLAASILGVLHCGCTGVRIIVIGEHVEAEIKSGVIENMTEPLDFCLLQLKRADAMDLNPPFDLGGYQQSVGFIAL